MTDSSGIGETTDTGPARAAPSGHAATRAPRIPAIDIARSAALLAMAVYHFVFDLEMFGHLPPGTAVTGGWRMLAVATASSFLALSGLSLVLAHGEGLRMRAFLRRWLMIAGAAGAITVLSLLAAPEAFIFFGILHAIAAMSVIGLAFLRVPATGLLLLAGVVVLAPSWLTHPVFDAQWLAWTGLATATRPSLDYVPVFPWFAAFLLGMAAGRAGRAAGLWARLAGWPKGGMAHALGWPGRHSLWVYLAHQPVLVALVWAGTALAG